MGKRRGFGSIDMESEGAFEKCFFGWETGRECILTINKLMRRGHIMVNGCYLCKEVVESCNHLLLWFSVIYCIRNGLWLTRYQLGN